MTTEGLDGVKQNGINILIKTIITRIFYFLARPWEPEREG
jgi:hypothetical protein